VWQDGQILRTGLFVEYHLHAVGIRWVLSGRLELNRATSGDPDPAFISIHPITGITQLNPGISLGGRKLLGEQFSLGLWLGRAQRSGSLTERYINFFPVGNDPYEMLGDPQIRPETNNQADLQLQWKSGGTVINVDVFASYLQDYISSSIDTSLYPRMPSSPGVRRFTNLERALLTGFELGWSQRLMAGLQHQLSMAYTYGQDLERQDALPEIAPFDVEYRLSGSYFRQKFKPWASLRYVVEQQRISKEFGETPTPAFTLVDLGLSLQLTSFLNISAGIHNLLDAAYYEHLSRAARGPEALPIHAPGRSYMLSFRLDFR
jgi:iron complex outermembrane receptor protein